jgi:CheY-like chemotaxis protein
MESIQSPHSRVPLLPWVLVAEDDENDFFFLQRAVAKANAAVRLVHTINGAVAMLYLEENQRDVPILIVTDLKMPAVDGFSLLTWLRSNPRFANIPVLIWSASEQQKDRDRAQALDAQSYHEKGIAHEGLTTLVAQICAAALSPGSSRQTDTAHG